MGAGPWSLPGGRGSEFPWFPPSRSQLKGHDLKRPSDFSHGQYPNAPLMLGPDNIAANARGQMAENSVRSRPGTGEPLYVTRVLAHPSMRSTWGQKGPWTQHSPSGWGKGSSPHSLPGEWGAPGERRSTMRVSSQSPRTPAEGFYGSGFSFRGVQPVTSRRSLTARGFPPTVHALGLAGVFLSY